MEDGREGSNECRYTLPGVLHFLQHDWSRFELERVQWDAEKAELTAKIAFLQGERRGQENIKRDLIRRIKMLEFALKKERIKGIFLICSEKGVILSKFFGVNSRRILLQRNFTDFEKSFGKNLLSKFKFRKNVFVDGYLRGCRKSLNIG